MHNVVKWPLATSCMKGIKLWSNCTCRGPRDYLRKWPPTPQNILEQKNINTGNNTSFNITPSIVSPNSTFNENGTVKLYKGKATKVSKICDDIETLIPNQNRLSRKCYYY